MFSLTIKLFKSTFCSSFSAVGALLIVLL
jgi:hypothetical protein